LQQALFVIVKIICLEDKSELKYILNPYGKAKEGCIGGTGR